MDAPPEMIENNVISDTFSSTIVLNIDAVAMSSIRTGALPAVVEDDASVDFGVYRRCPVADA